MPKGDTVRVLIADEHRNFRNDMRKLLQAQPDIEIVGEVSDGPSAVRLTRRVAPDVLILDFDLSQGIDPQELDGFISRSSVRIIVTVSALAKFHLVEAFQLGVHGVVLKTSPASVLLNSIRSVSHGQYWLDSISLGMLVEAFREAVPQGTTANSRKDYGLTRRELDIITKIVGGHSNREVGQEFSISERTVKHHLTNIFTKVGVSSRLQLALFAVNHNLMSSQSPALSLEPLPLNEDA